MMRIVITGSHRYYGATPIGVCRSEQIFTLVNSGTIWGVRVADQVRLMRRVKLRRFLTSLPNSSPANEPLGIVHEDYFVFLEHRHEDALQLALP